MCIRDRPIGDHLVELGFAQFKELAVEFTTDQTGEVNVIDVVDLDTDQTMWDPKILDDLKINKKNIVGHNEIAPGRKTDPGPYFDWDLLKSML